MKTPFNILTLIFLTLQTAFSMHGKLLLVGGGTERDTPNSWSTPAFQWAINQSVNKKAIIVHYETTSTFYPTYLTGQCGAISAKNLIINASNANLQATYDTLMNYDFIFFRGGDQSQYYNFYKNTKTSQALTDKFNAGGVIGGTSAGLHILSGVIYNAQDVSVAPLEAMINVASSAITLKNDFLNLFPGYIFDSHVVERGRLPRTIAFMAKWYNSQNQKIRGVMVDDLTAMGIDTSETGTVFGTGSVGILENKSIQGTPYSTSGKLKTDSIQLKQLLNGWKYSFKTHTVTATGSQLITPDFTSDNLQEKLNSTVMLSGADDLANNSIFLDHFVKKIGKPEFPIAIITGSDTAMAKTFKTACISRGAKRVKIIRLLGLNTTTIVSLLDTIQQTNKYLFVNNNWAQLNSALSIDGVGSLIKRKIQLKGVVVGFVGNNSRFVGKSILSDNYTTASASYDSLLTTQKGLGLLNTIVFPNAFFNSTMYENSVSATPYFMLADTAIHGILLSGNSYVKYASKSDNKAYFTSDGTQNAIIFKSRSNVKAGFSRTVSGRSTIMRARQVSGFEDMHLSIVDTNSTFIAANNIEYAEIQDSLLEIAATKTMNLSFSNISIYPNPVENILKIQGIENEEIESIKIFNSIGNEILETKKINIPEIEISNLLSGVYMVFVKTNKSLFYSKFVK